MSTFTQWPSSFRSPHQKLACISLYFPCTCYMPYLYTRWAKSRYTVIVYCIPTFGPPCIFLHWVNLVTFVEECNLGTSLRNFLQTAATSSPSGPNTPPPAVPHSTPPASVPCSKTDTKFHTHVQQKQHYSSV